MAVLYFCVTENVLESSGSLKERLYLTNVHLISLTAPEECNVDLILTKNAEELLTSRL